MEQMGKQTSHQPIRTCVGCRGKAEQHQLLRVAVRDGQVTVDPMRRLPGRGAYLHPRRECLERAARRGGVARAFRRSIAPAEILGLSHEAFANAECGLPPARGDGK